MLLYYLFGLLLFFHAAPVSADDVLTLDAAEQMAVTRHPALAQAQSEVTAAQARAHYAGLLPSPQFRLGAESLPTDSLALDRDEMTQLSLGIAQAFPPAGVLALSQHSAAQEGRALAAQARDQLEQVRRDARQAWLALFYNERALALHHIDIELMDQILRTALAQYQVGKTPETAVLQAQLERDELLDHEQTLLAETQAARSRLARLTNPPEGDIHLPKELPALADMPTQAQLLTALAEHPLLRAADARIDMSATETALAERSRLPEVGLSASYGYRLARRDGVKIPDLLSLGLTLTLPLPERQDAHIAEMQARRLAARYRRDDMLLQLRQTLESRYAAYEHLKNRLRFLQEQVLPEAQQHVDAALAAYQVSKMDMADVLRARKMSLDFTLRLWRVRVDLASAAADLQYLAAQEAADEH